MDPDPGTVCCTELPWHHCKCCSRGTLCSRPAPGLSGGLKYIPACADWLLPRTVRGLLVDPAVSVRIQGGAALANLGATIRAAEDTGALTSTNELKDVLTQLTEGQCCCNLTVKISYCMYNTSARGKCRSPEWIYSGHSYSSCVCCSRSESSSRHGEGERECLACIGELPGSQLRATMQPR